MMTALGCRGTQSIKPSFGKLKSLQRGPTINAALQRKVLEDFQRNSEAIQAENAAALSRADGESKSNIKLTSAQSDVESRESEFVIRGQSFSELATTATSSYPIDFPTVLQLAGADNWNVKIARARTQEAAAKYCAAKSEWMPSITVSAGFNKHEGEIQATEGDVVSVSRNSLFLGAGAGVQNAPLNGGSGGPPRMFVDFSMADALFNPLAARQVLGAEQSRQNRVFNDTMLESSLAYYELVGAQSRQSIAQTNLNESEQLAVLTDAFVDAGKGTSSDSSRVNVIVNNRRNELATANAELKIASARLATILQLDPTKLDPVQGLIAMDAEPAPLDLVPIEFDLRSTIAQAQDVRCEIAEATARARSAQTELKAEEWRPWLPNLYVGYSGGLFGGGTGSDLNSLDGRSDLDAVVSWQVKNLGFGSRARQDESRSKTYQRNYELQQIRDQIAEQVTTTYQRVEQFRSMSGLLASNVQQAGDGLEKNLAAIKALEGMPLEAISSLEQLAKARTDYVTTVTNYNQWQIRLIRAAGQSLSPDASFGQTANCDVYSAGCNVAEPACSRCITKP